MKAFTQEFAENYKPSEYSTLPSNHGDNL